MYSVSADESLEERTALRADQVTHLLHLYLRTTYFQFQGNYYQQKDAATMGSPVSPVMAQIYIEMYEDLTLRTKQVSRIWKICADDTFCMIEEMKARNFLDHLISLHPTIQCTMEMEGWEHSFAWHTSGMEGGWEYRH